MSSGKEVTKTLAAAGTRTTVQYACTSARVCVRACLCVFQHSWAGAFEEFLLTSPEQETTEENKEKKV